MGNHDVWDTPERRAKEILEEAEEAQKKAFMKEVVTVRNRVLKQRASLFTAAELERLFDMRWASPGCTLDDFHWLQNLEHRSQKRKFSKT